VRGDDGPALRCLASADFERFQVTEALSPSLSLTHGIADVLRREEGGGEECDADKGTLSEALVRYFSFATDTSWGPALPEGQLERDVAPLRRRWGYAQGCGATGTEERDVDEAEFVVVGGGESARENGCRAAGNASVRGLGWSLKDGPAVAGRQEGSTGGGTTRCERVSEEAALYTFSKAGAAEVDVYRRSVSLERLVCDNVASLDGA